MKSVTVTLPDKLYQKAQRAALENEVTLSSLLRGELEKAIGQIENTGRQRSGHTLASAFAQVEHLPKKRAGKLNRELLYADRLKLR